jgi:hypothetical protein
MKVPKWQVADANAALALQARSFTALLRIPWSARP